MIPLLSIQPENINPKHLDEVVCVLKGGGVIIYPTDTVYAMGCLSDRPRAIARLAKMKGIKVEKSRFSFLFKDISDLSEYVKPFDTPTFKLLNRSLPGPYTFLLPAVKKLPKPFNKRKRIGVRIVDFPFINQLLEKLSTPLITTSIHHQDQVVDYETDPNIIYEMWCEQIDYMIEMGYGGNRPSTVVDLSVSPFEILREGKGSLDLL